MSGYIFVALQSKLCQGAYICSISTNDGQPTMVREYTSVAVDLDDS